MPGFDKTGPEGQGPLTGRRKGKCNDADVENNLTTEEPKDKSGEIVYGVGRGGKPYGGGRGKCFGGGRRRRGNGRWREFNNE
jgi:hypothetical protein